MEYRGAVVTVTLAKYIAEEKIKECMEMVGCDRYEAIDIIQSNISFDEWNVDDANTEDVWEYD